LLYIIILVFRDRVLIINSPYYLRRLLSV